jgi:plasmid maintenance system antidote protein VapI
MDAMTTPSGSPADRLRAAAAAARVPAAVVDAWNAPPPDPEPGQVWRARWDTHYQLVLLLAVTGSTVAAVPASLEPDLADDTAEVLAERDTTLGVPLALWRSLSRTLPMRVLDRLAGHVNIAEGALVHGQAKPTPRNVGEPVVTPTDPRVEYRALLEDNMTAFAEASWEPQGAGTLDRMLREAGVGPADLGNALGATPQHALRILRGSAPITEEQAEALAELTGRAVEELLDANPPLPTDLVERLDRPTCRALVTELAHRRHQTEQLAWQSAGYGVLALAARQTGRAKSIAWDDRINRYFTVVLGD